VDECKPLMRGTSRVGGAGLGETIGRTLDAALSPLPLPGEADSTHQSFRQGFTLVTISARLQLFLRPQDPT